MNNLWGPSRCPGSHVGVIRLIHNHSHFQSPSPAWPRHYGARLQSNFLLSHRMSIRSCLCWRCAPLIFMSCAGITDASRCLVNMISEACVCVFFFHPNVNTCDGAKHTHKCGHKNTVERLSHSGHQLITINCVSQSGVVTSPGAWCSPFTDSAPVMLLFI